MCILVGHGTQGFLALRARNDDLTLELEVKTRVATRFSKGHAPPGLGHGLPLI